MDTKAKSVSEETYSEFIDRYLESSISVEEYENGHQLYEFIDGNGFGGMLLFGVLGILAGALIDEFASFSVNSTWVFALFMAVYLISYLLIYRAVVDSLEDHDLSSKAITYHYLAVAMRGLENENYDEVANAIAEVSKWLDEERFGGLHQNHNEVIRELAEIVEEAPDEQEAAILAAINSSMPLVADQIIAIEESPFDEVTKDIELEDAETSRSRYQFLIKSLSDIRYSGPIKAILPFLGVAALGLVIFYQVNQQLGMFSVIVLIPAVQYLINRNDSD